jgi:uncharacterized protein YeaO (DUF488 family)
MLRQATLEQVRQGSLRSAGVPCCIVGVSRHYPRGLKRDLLDRYIADLGPPASLLAEFKDEERRSGSHEEAWELSRYERRFKLSPEGWERLRSVSFLSRDQDVWLVCHCKLTQRCHRELLLLAARERFGVAIEKPSRDYPVFLERLRGGDV